MKKKTYLLILFFISFSLFSCNQVDDCCIESAEFKSANEIRVYLSAVYSETEISYEVYVYISKKLDKSYQIKSHKDSSFFECYSDITLNKDVPVGADVIIQPGVNSNGMSGSATITRME